MTRFLPRAWLVGCMLLGVWGSTAQAQPQTQAAPVEPQPPVQSVPASTSAPVPASASTPAPAAASTPGSPATQIPTPTISVEVHGEHEKADALRRASGSKTTVTEEEIKQAQPENTTEILRRVPGIQIRQEDQSGYRLNIGVRGLSPTRSRLVLVEEDGVPVVVSPYGEPELYYMTSIERIRSLEVLKGSEVLRYGPQTVGAVIQLRTWEPTETRFWYTSFTAGLRNELGAMARYSDRLPGGGGYVVQAYFNQGDGYRQMGFRAADVFAKLHIPTGPSGDLMVKAAFHRDLTHTTYTGLTDTLYRQNPRQDTVAPDDHFGLDRYDIAIRHELRLVSPTLFRTTLFAYQTNTDLRLQDFDRSPLPGFTYVRTPDPSGLFFRATTSLRNRTYNVMGISEEVERRFETLSWHHKLVAGVRGIYDSTRRRLSHGLFPQAESGDIVTDDTTSIFGLSGWLEDQIAIGDLVLITPAFRVEYSHSTKHIYRTNDPMYIHQDVDLTGSASASGVMPGVSVVVGKARLNVFGSFHVGYSAPRISQSIKPNGQDADLHAEDSTNWELGLRGRIAPWLRAEGDLFAINFGNELISNNPLLSGTSSEFIDGGSTRHYGVESTIALRMGQLFHWPIDVDLAGQYTFVQASFVGGQFDGHTVPYSPTSTVAATLDVSHASGMGAQAALSYVGSQYTDERNTIAPSPSGLNGQIDSYSTLDLGARYRNPHSGLGIGVTVKNALDRVYISDRLPNGIFMAGFRQILGTLSWSGG